MLAKEHDASLHKPAFSYTSIERSERTGGHEWTEEVVEVPEGKLRYLLSEDGKPLSPEKKRSELSRLQSIAEDPQAFIRRERAQKDEEQRAQQILNLLPRAFLFQECGIQQGWEQINYRPNPSYVPQSYEERILHEMTGTILIDPDSYRLHMLEGTLSKDVSFGYGLLATLHAGSSFSIVRSPILPGAWKNTKIDVHMDGHVILFKTISRQQDAQHKDFKLLPSTLTIPQAIALMTR